MQKIINMKNKNKVAIVLLLLVMFSFFSCKKDILDVAPSDKITADQVLSTRTSFEALRVGLYNQLGGKGNPNLYQMLMPLMGDFLGNDMVYGSTWYVTFNPEHQHTTSPESTGILDVWSRCYYATEVANTIINGESQITELYSADAAAAYIAEAKAIRGMIYYDCSKFYGKAYHLDNGASLSMPYVDYIDYEALPFRSSMEEIYTKAIADITSAIPYLPAISSDAERKMMNKNAAYAVLSRIYLDMRDYTQALNYAELAVEGIGFLTTEEYALGLSHINEETILGFVLHSDNYLKWRSFNSFHDPYDGMGDDFLANYTLYDIIGTDDIRKKFFWHEWFYYDMYLDNTWEDVAAAYSTASWWAWVDIKQPKGYYTYGKFPRMDVVFGSSGETGTLGLGHYSCIRSSEMHLTIAECQARLGDASSAQQNLFKTVSRSIATAIISTNTGQTLIDEILLERRKELFGEGHGYRDLLRLGNGIVRDGSQPVHEIIPAGDPRLQWPIPQREVNANPNLGGN